MTFQKILGRCVLFSDIIWYLLTCCAHVVFMLCILCVCKTSELFAQSLHAVQINQIFFVQNLVRVKFKNPWTETSENNLLSHITYTQLLWLPYGYINFQCFILKFRTSGLGGVNEVLRPTVLNLGYLIVFLHRCRNDMLCAILILSLITNSTLFPMSQYWTLRYHKTKDQSIVFISLLTFL